MDFEKRLKRRIGWDKHGVSEVIGTILTMTITVVPGDSSVDPFEISMGLIMLIGLVLIALTRYGDMGTISKIVYPLFHATAGLTIFFIPILTVKNGTTPGSFINVTIDGTLIGLGGIALAFLTAGKQLLFFSQDFVLMILAPLLFLTALFFALGLTKE